ncbi:MAG: MFS transporter [Candidatus Bathyarchaeales archaeon]
MGHTSKQGRLNKFVANFSFLKGNLLILTISWMFWFPAIRLTESYGQLYIIALGASTIILGAINSISTATLAIVRILGGYIADRFGRKKILTTMTFAITATYLIYAFAPNLGWLLPGWQWILIGATLQNVFLLYQPALVALRADSVPSEKRGFGFALTEFLPGIISIPAPIIATWLVLTNGTVQGMQIAYFAAFTLGLAAGVVRLWLKETLPERKDKRQDKFQNDFKKEYADAVRFIFKNMRNIALFYILYNFAFLGVSPLFSIYAKFFMELGDAGWGAMYAVSYILYLVLLIPTGLMVDKFGRRKILLLSLGFLVVFSFIYAVTPLTMPYDMRLVVLVTVYSVILLANVAQVNAVSALEADYIPREKRGRVTAALAFVASLSGAFGQILGGFEYETVDPRFPFIALTVFMILSFTVVFFKIKEPETREE